MSFNLCPLWLLVAAGLISCRSHDTRLLANNSETLNYAQVRGPEEAPDWVKGQGQLIWQDEFSSTEGITSLYRAWWPGEDPDEGGYPLVVFLHGNMGSNYGPHKLSKAISTSSAAKLDGGNGQRFPTLEQARFEAHKGERFWDKAVFVSILTPFFTHYKLSSKELAQGHTDHEDRKKRIVFNKQDIMSFGDEFYIYRPSSKGHKMATWGSPHSKLSILPKQKLEAGARFVTQLIHEKILATGVEINDSKVVLVGQSGGALFLANSLLPFLTKDSDLRGSAIFLCGMDAPTIGELDPQKFKIHFHSTANESSGLRGEGRVIENGINQYGRAWFKTEWQNLDDATLFASDYSLSKPGFSIAVDGDGKHCKFATQSQPKIVTSALQHHFPHWAELQ